MSHKNPYSLLVLIASILLSHRAFAMGKHSYHVNEPGDGETNTAAQTKQPQLANNFTIISADDLSSEDFQKASASLKKHIDETYSKDFMQKTGLQRIVLHRSLAINGVSVGGHALLPQIELSTLKMLENPAVDEKKCENTPDMSSKLTCLSSIESDRKYISQSNADANELLNYLFDHELFHIIEQNLGTIDEHSAPNLKWAQLNPASFSYIGTGLQAIAAQQIVTSNYSLNQEFKLGFISHYATASIAEDKAEIYSHYMRNPNNFLSLAQRDSTLYNKLGIVSNLVNQLAGDTKFLPAAFQTFTGNKQ